VFGANVGTTGTGWLVALIGLRVSLSSYALPMIFVGALTKLLASGRIAAAGASLAGFALVLYGLTTLQQGMGGIAESIHPADLPAVLGAPDIGWVSGWTGLLTLVLAGLVMTAVMQSSTAAIAVTLAAFGAGAIGLNQGCALIIGQNIGTATSSGMAAIGASTTAKRLALAYVLFKLVAALIALAVFPLTMPLMQRWLGAVDGLTLLAAYHTAYNVVGVVVLLPAVDWFTRFVEQLLPSKGPALTPSLDPAALVNPVVAVETARRAVANVMKALCVSIVASLAGESGKDGGAPQTAATLKEAREYLSELKEPSGSEEESQRLTHTLHALEHTSRLAELIGNGDPLVPASGGADDMRAAEFCKGAMRWAQMIAGSIMAESALSPHAQPIGWEASPEAEAALAELESIAGALRSLQRQHRAATLVAVAPGKLSAEEAFARVDAVRRLDGMTHHAWRAATHLLGRD
jgi:phosphate:Na+ symporter